MQIKGYFITFLISIIFLIPNILEAQSELNKTELDVSLRGKWEEMKDALANKDIKKALSYFAVETREHYKEMFTALYDQLPQLVQDMQDIELIHVKDNIAKYRIRKDELYGGQTLPITYYIYFVVDTDGIWRIYKY